MSETKLSPLVVEQLVKRFGKHTVLDGVDMNVDAGAIHGLVGLNGAGKTTTMSCVLGLQRFQQGKIRVLDKSPQQLHHNQGKVAAVFDEPCLHPHFSVEEVLRFAQLSVGNNNRSNVESLLKTLGIERYRKFKIKNLSLGNRRRAAIAQALITQPAFMILDEPFNGLDAGGVDDVLALIKHLNKSQGISFLLASHQLSYLESICTDMSILHQGKVVKSGAIKNLLVDECTRVAIQTQNPAALREYLITLPGVQPTQVTDDVGNEENAVVCELLNLNSAELNRQLVEAGFAISELRLYKPSLSTLFRSVTGVRE